MSISAVNPGSPSYFSATRRRDTAKESGFAQNLADQIAAQKTTGSTTAKAIVKASVSTDPSQWKAVASDGTVWTVTNVAASLTSNDKAVLGWPSNNQAIMFAGVMVAMDRHDGTLKGPITRDYILGNIDKHIAGLVERFPRGEFSPQTLDAMLSKVGA